MGLSIKWGKVDTTAKSNSTPSMSNYQNFSNASLLKLDETLLDTVDYATVGELNQTILDNEQPVIPNSPDPNKVVLWSKLCSDNQGYFRDANGNLSYPTLTITFSDVVTSSGITLYFWPHKNEYCRRILVTWYDSNGSILSSKYFYPDNYDYFCSNYIEQYKKVVIRFDRTTLPYRFAKITGIQYGEKIELTSKNIVAASLIESIGITSSKLFTNQLDCDIISLDNNFDIITNPGSFTGIQANQKLTVSSDTKEYGMYFVQKSVVSGKIISIVGYDLIGYLETREFKGGLYSNVTFEHILNQIKSQANLTDVFGGEHSGFEVSTTILNKIVSGYIPYTNCREALHQLCYASNVVANCVRGEKIKIFEIDDVTVKDTLDNSKLIMDSLKIEENEIYTQVSLNSFSYKEDSDERELENKIYEVGEHTIRFSQPYRNYTITGATIVESGHNYITFNVTTQGTVIIKGYGYTETTQQFVAKNVNYTGNTPSIKEMSDVRMVSPNIAQEVANAQLSLYLLKYKLSSDIYNINANIGDKVIIGNASGNIQKIETDLIAEDVCSVEVLGNATTNN